MSEFDTNSREGEVHAHIASWQFYVGILGALLVLTALTVAVSFVKLGPLNLVVAVVIATIKASLVVTFFMHLKYDNRFNALIFLSSLLFVGIFLAYTFNDTAHRAELDSYNGATVSPVTGEVAPGRRK
ncbi:MAG: cytochrome C oxidase subunit IV family protein [Myxococcales bacterium]|nr:MAG: cytochrome C oxidase subunit IV family protein [Myxococcales bacterium]